MKTFTIRGIDEELDSKLKSAAKNKSISVNQFIIKTLQKVMGLDKKTNHTQRYHDLDFLFGTWDEEEFLEFQKSQEDFEKIDKEMWDL